MDAAAYLRRENDRFGKKSERVKEFSVFNFNYIPSEPLMRDEIKGLLEAIVRFDIGGDQQRVHEIDTDVRDVTFKHILLPVWLAAYKYRGQTYRFVVNGRSGKVQGERPWSVWKIAFAVVLGLIVAGAAGWLVAQQG